MWVKRLLYGEKYSGWKVTFDHFFRSLGGRIIFLCNYDIKKMDLNGIPLFYIDMLKAWQELDKCRHFGENKNNPLIFNNKCICLSNKTIFDVELFQKGIFQASYIIVRGHLKPILHFYNLGFPNKQNHVKITSISRYRLEESYVLQTPDIYVNVLIRLLH